MVELFTGRYAIGVNGNGAVVKAVSRGGNILGL